MYQNQGRACKPCLGPLLAGVSKSPKVFQNHQCSDQLIPECFKITKSVSKSPKIPLDLSRDLDTWSVTWSSTWSVLVAECFKITKSVSKSPKIVPSSYWVIHNYTILVCFACLAYIMDRFVKRVATPPVNPTQAWFVDCDVNATWPNNSWQHSDFWSGLILSWQHKTEWRNGSASGHLITIPYTLAADVSVTNQKYCLKILNFTA